MRPRSFRNPLGFHCPPNGTDPSYVAEHDFERFVAFGMLMSYEHLLGLGTEKLDADTFDVYWLRKNFLDTLEMAIGFLPAMKEEVGDHINYAGDQQENTVPVRFKDNNQSADALDMGWRFERYDRDDSLLFALSWGEDDLAVWLREDALADRGDVIAKARVWNEQNQGTIARPN